MGGMIWPRSLALSQRAAVSSRSAYRAAVLSRGFASSAARLRESFLCLCTVNY